MKNPRGSAAVTDDEGFIMPLSHEGKAKPEDDPEARRPAYDCSSTSLAKKLLRERQDGGLSASFSVPSHC